MSCDRAREWQAIWKAPGDIIAISGEFVPGRLRRARRALDSTEGE